MVVFWCAHLYFAWNFPSVHTRINRLILLCLLSFFLVLHFTIIHGKSQDQNGTLTLEIMFKNINLCNVKTKMRKKIMQFLLFMYRYCLAWTKLISIVVFIQINSAGMLRPSKHQSSYKVSNVLVLNFKFCLNT